MPIAQDQWRQVALSDTEYGHILELLGREPSPVELGMFGAMWSEHCGYKHSRPLLKTLPTDAPWVLQGPGENAGAVDLGNGLAAVFKVESHNHPSAVEPYEGAATGVGGIVRDIFTMGARPVAILDGLRFGELSDPRNRYLFENVVGGIGGYGNCLGIPTVGGEVAFDSSFNGNPIVNAMCIGVVHADSIVRATASGVGNLIVLIGAKTGRDGLHGATFASVDDPEASHRGVVQVGNPFLEKQLMEACLELLRGDAVVAMQDLGAAGLTSAIIECASRGSVGVTIDVADVPRRETGMTAYECMLSESQERMVLVAAPDRFEEIADTLARWELDATIIGRITDDGIVRVADRGDVHVTVPVSLFIDECPVYHVEGEEPHDIRSLRERPPTDLQDIGPAEVADALLLMLQSPALGSRQPIWEQYDHTIQTNTVLGPGCGDAAVIRIKGTQSAIAASMDCNSRYCYLDPYRGAQLAVAEATRNVSCVGGRPLGLTNCLNFGNPERSPANWQLREAVRGMGDAALALGVPVVSGNVSLYNESSGLPIQPTPMIGCVGVLEDVSVATAIRWRDGDTVMLLDGGPPTLGGSEYLEIMHGQISGSPSAPDFAQELNVQALVRQLIGAGLCSGVHDVSNGGLAVALAELAMASSVGATIASHGGSGRLDVGWFGECASRVLVAVEAGRLGDVERSAASSGVSAVRLGLVGGDNLVLGNAPPVPVKELHTASGRAFHGMRDHASI